MGLVITQWNIVETGSLINNRSVWVPYCKNFNLECINSFCGAPVFGLRVTFSPALKARLDTSLTCFAVFLILKFMSVVTPAIPCHYFCKI